MTPQPPYKIFLGWDASQIRAWNVAAYSARTHSSVDLDISRITMTTLHAQGLYRRPTRLVDPGYWDEISGAPMSTGHAIARFLVPALCQYDGWALFADGDVLVRADLADLFALADPDKAIQVVQHQHNPQHTLKMTGHAQTTYARKNWSSVVLWHCGHPANRALTIDLVNTLPGRDLHRFCWLSDDLIGALPPRWNVLIGEEQDPDPAICHYTLGLPDLQGYEHQPYADEWYAVAMKAGYRLRQPPRRVETVA